MEWAEVEILIYQRFKNIIDEMRYTNNNIIQVALKINNKRTHFISIYTPDINKPRKERGLFFEDQQDMLNKISNNKGIFIMVILIENRHYTHSGRHAIVQ